jgi:predicted esterase
MPPRAPQPLPVEGFFPASHVGPEDLSGPKPVTVVLHGNYDRPEWQCETWQRVAAFRGWVLCPRGTPTPWASPAEDRWHYPGRKAVEREIEAALEALETRYAPLVSREEMVLAGFSLGAIYAPGVIIGRPGRFAYLFLIEGGVDKLDKWQLNALKRAGVKGIGMAMSSPKYRSAAKSLMKKIAKRGMRAVFVDMKGAGHNYRSDFVDTGRDALASLIEGRE